MFMDISRKPITAVPHRTDFEALLRRLGRTTADAIRNYLDQVIDNFPPTSNGYRTFGSSQLGRQLSPWQEPLRQLWLQSREFLGADARAQDVEDRAALWFGLFVWERIMDRDESWVVYDPNVSSIDPNREPLGKMYFEQPPDA
jgi:hypothetical protein